MTLFVDVPSDDDYGQLYCPSGTETESVDLNNKIRGNGQVVGGPHQNYYDFSTSSYDQDPVPGTIHKLR